ncbi:Polypeptide N-acetylgalactosaminyltransferase 12 [Branchiostoma belcheri]|nr:Polypeptide N-acetylgalactosaminyltransferase 12 [Branchiostoma belcheri]
MSSDNGKGAGLGPYRLETFRWWSSKLSAAVYNSPGQAGLGADPTVVDTLVPCDITDVTSEARSSPLESRSCVGIPRGFSGDIATSITFGVTLPSDKCYRAPALGRDSTLAFKIADRELKVTRSSEFSYPEAAENLTAANSGGPTWLVTRRDVLRREVGQTTGFLESVRTMMRRACRRHGLGLVCKALKAVLASAALLLVYTYAADYRKGAAPHHHARRVKFAALPVDERYIKERLDPEPTRGLDSRVRAAMQLASTRRSRERNASPVSRGAWLAYASPRAQKAKFARAANSGVGVRAGNNTRLDRARSGDSQFRESQRARVPKRWSLLLNNSNRNNNNAVGNNRENDNGNIGVQQATPGPQALGELGQGVVLRNLSPEDRRRLEEGYKKYAFNEFASSKIALTRTIPDGRHWL